MIATANTGNTRERFWKNAVEWTEGLKLAGRKSLAVSVWLYTDLLQLERENV